MASNETLRQKLTEAVWERLAADVSVGRGMLRSSVEEAVAGVLALHESERQKLLVGIDPAKPGSDETVYMQRIVKGSTLTPYRYKSIRDMSQAAE